MRVVFAQDDETVVYVQNGQQLLTNALLNDESFRSNLAHKLVGPVAFRIQIGWPLTGRKEKTLSGIVTNSEK